MLFEKDGVLYSQGNKVMVQEPGPERFLWPGTLVGHGGYSDYYSVRMDDNPAYTEAFSIEQISPYNRRLDPRPSFVWHILFITPLLFLGIMVRLLHLKLGEDEAVPREPALYWLHKAMGCCRVLLTATDGTVRRLGERVRVKGRLGRLVRYDTHTKQVDVKFIH